jgi:hypothetical protein
MWYLGPHIMGIDFQFIGYAGAPLADESLAQAIVQHVRTVTLFRHAKASLPGREDFHCIALYEGPDDSTVALKVSLPTPEELPKDAPLSAIVQAAWKVARQAIKEMPAAPASHEETEDAELSRVAILARELSRVVGQAFWVSQGDHSCVGGYALFENGRLVDPASEKDIYVDGDRYLDVPEKKWLAATGTRVIPNDVFFTAFPDTDGPPLRLATDLSKSMTFDPVEFEVSLE